MFPKFSARPSFVAMVKCEHIVLGQTCTFTDLKLGSVTVVTIVSRLALKSCFKCRKRKRVTYRLKIGSRKKFANGNNSFIRVTFTRENDCVREL